MKKIIITIISCICFCLGVFIGYLIKPDKPKSTETIATIWVARNRNYTLRGFDHKPHLLQKKTWVNNSYGTGYLLDWGLLDEVTYYNSPQQIEIRLIK